MKWEEIYDQSKCIVRRVVERLSKDEPAGFPDEKDETGDIASRLRDSDYLLAEFERRGRYDYRVAYRGLRRQERRRKRSRVVAMMSGAACVVAACCLLMFRGETPEKTPRTVVQLAPSRGMKAILVKADGEELMLNEESRQLSDVARVRVVVDSTGIQYEVNDQPGEDTLEYNTLVIPRGGVYQLTLGDGTRVWLNSDSRLVYPVVFSGDTRKVTLSGEAYFDVARDTSLPFIVETDLGRVRVLGTRFNVKFYPEEAYITTTLVSGKVSFGNAVIRDTELAPGYQLVYEEGRDKATMRKVNVQHFTGWKDHQISFQGETLGSITRMLARWYDVEVVFEDESLKQLEFSGNLDKYENIETFFRLFELGADIQFVIRGKEVRVKRKK